MRDVLVVTLGTGIGGGIDAWAVELFDGPRRTRRRDRARSRCDPSEAGGRGLPVRLERLPRRVRLGDRDAAASHRVAGSRRRKMDGNVRTALRARPKQGPGPERDAASTPVGRGSGTVVWPMRPRCCWTSSTFVWSRGGFGEPRWTSSEVPGASSRASRKPGSYGKRTLLASSPPQLGSDAGWIGAARLRLDQPLAWNVPG